MNDKFDELAKGMAQSVTRRGAFKKFGLGFAGIALAVFGLVNKAQAVHNYENCVRQCCKQCVRKGGDVDLCCNYCRVTCAHI